MMATAIVTDKMQAKAERLAAIVPFLHRGRSKHNGQGFVLMPGSQPGVVYYSNRLGCTCPSFRHRGVCAHQQACQIAYQRAETAIIEAAQRCKEPDCGRMRVGRSGRCWDCVQKHADQLGI